MNKKPTYFLAVILLLALFLRLLFLGQLPRGFTPDEASQAYSAFSLLKTGADEWGKSWPLLSFKSFLDYKAPLQTYLMIPSIFAFGLTEFAARLPSAIFGILAVFTIYLLVNQLFPQFKLKFKNLDLSAGHLAALVLTITPWHLQFSRMALEANLTSFLFPLGLWAFLKGLKRPRWFMLTSLSWGLSLYAYHSVKLFLPLFTVALLIIYWSQLKKLTLSDLWPTVALAAFLALPIYYATLFTSAGSRGTDLLITNLSTLERQSLLYQKAFSPLAKIHPYLSAVFHNPLVEVIDQFITNYLSYFTFSFWFTEGGREITYSIIPGRGLLFLWQLPFVLLGIYHLLKKYSTNSQLLFAWLFLSPLPAALTKQGYRPNRTSLLLGFWALLTALGLILAFKSIKAGWFKLLTCLVILVSLVFYLNDYAFAHHLRNPTSMSYGWRQAVNQLQNLPDDYSQIVVERGNQSQSLVAFYLKYPPEKFQQASQNWQQKIDRQQVQYLDQLGEYQLGKYHFDDLNWPDNIRSDTLYLSHQLKNLPKQRRTLHQVQTKDRQTLIEIFDFPHEE